MTVTRPMSLARRVAAIAALASLLAGCANITETTPGPTATPIPTSMSVPSFTPAPSPSDCPTAAPAAMATDQTATVVMNTNFGAITIKVDGKLGPNAAGAFVALAKCGYYNNVMFHRVMPKFVIQAGDGQYARWPIDQLSLGRVGTGGPVWTVKDDPVKTKYARGTVAMARKPGATDSGSSQFFIVLDDAAATSLAGQGANNYAIFGNVTAGMDVVDKIAKVPTGGPADTQGNPGTIPTVPVVILTTTVTQP